jgi:hypothetical protein
MRLSWAAMNNRLLSPKAFVAFCVLVLTAGAVPSLAADKATGSVSGKVVDAAGRGNESVKVTVQDGDKVLGTGYTDSDGKFSISDVPAGRGYTILAVRALRGLTMSGQKPDVAVKAGKTSDVGNIEINVGSPG